MSIKSKMIHVRIESELKEKAENILKQLGISSGEAIRMFFSQIVLKREIPFSLDLEAEDKKENYIKVENDDHLKDLMGL